MYIILCVCTSKQELIHCLTLMMSVCFENVSFIQTNNCVFDNNVQYRWILHGVYYTVVYTVSSWKLVEKDHLQLASCAYCVYNHS